MTNTALLEELIARSGKKKKFLAEKCGLSTTGFRNCVNNAAEWRVSHITILCAELGIKDLETKDAIFFARTGA